MGLDIYHFRASDRPDPTQFFRVEPYMSEMQPLASYFQQHENEHLDWEGMFSSQGLDFKRHRLMVQTRAGKYACYVFTDAEGAGINGPVRAIFSNERRAFFPFLQRSRFRLPLQTSAYKNALRVFGPFATVMKKETVVFFENAGYQRNSVSQTFYQVFAPDDATCSMERVNAIYEATLPEAREHFKRNFIDSWEDGRSFVVISY